MLAEIDQFVNWVRRRNPEARTWRDYGYDLHQFVEVVGTSTTQGNHLPGYRSFHRRSSRARLQAHHHQPPPGRHPGAVSVPLSPR